MLEVCHMGYFFILQISICFCACFEKVVRPRQDILEQKSTVTAQNRCPKIRRDKFCCKASILATGQRLSFIIIVLQTLALSYQSRPIYSEPPYTIRAIVYLPSISISLLSIFIFRLVNQVKQSFHKQEGHDGPVTLT